MSGSSRGQSSTMQSFDKVIALWPAYRVSPEFNPPVARTARWDDGQGVRRTRASYLTGDGIDTRFMCFKERQDRFIEHMNRSHRQLAGIVPSPGMTVLAVQHDSQIHLVPLEYTDDEGIARHQFPNVVNFDLAFAKLRTEALEQANLFIIELHRLLPMGFLEAQQAAELGKQVVTLSYATQIARTDVDALQTRLCADHSGYWVGLVRELSRMACSISGATRLGCALYSRAVCRASPRPISLQALLTLLRSLASFNKRSLQRAIFSLQVNGDSR